MKKKIIKANEKKINWLGTYQWFKLTQTHIDRLEEYKTYLNWTNQYECKIAPNTAHNKGVITKLQNYINDAYLYPDFDNNTKQHTYDCDDYRRRVDELKKGGIWADFITDKQAELLNELEFWYHNIIGDLDLSDGKVRACAELMYMWSDSVAPTYTININKRLDSVHYQICKYITKNQYNQFIEYSKQFKK
jgi:hypothetical protein